jgi:hypothetical protein
MTKLAFTATDDLERMWEVPDVRGAAAALGYAIDDRHAHAVLMAWRTTHGKRILTDDGWETSAPDMPFSEPAFEAFLLSVCHKVD